VTTPDHEDTETAKAEVDAALEQAKAIQTRGAMIAAGWRKSRLDNNFRQMLRAMSQRAERHG
jgi:hypothetical protein